MRKILTGLVSGIALLGLAACGETDGTTTESIDQGDDTIQAPADGGAVAPTDDPATQDLDDGAAGDANTVQ